jgi:hypothetical protein
MARPADGFRRGLASPLCAANPPEEKADSAKECGGGTPKVKLHYSNEPEEGIVVGPRHEGSHVGMHDGIQQRMRHAADETTHDYPQRREFTSGG